MKKIQQFWKWLQRHLSVMLLDLFMQGYRAGRCDEGEDRKLENACRASGVPQQDLVLLRPNDMYMDTGGDVASHVKRSRSRKERYVTPLNDAPLFLANCAKMQGSKFVILRLPKSAPTHAWRAAQARALYDQLKRPIDTIPAKERYYCRRQWAGTIYDKRALRLVADMLELDRIAAVVSLLRYCGRN